MELPFEIDILPYVKTDILILLEKHQVRIPIESDVRTSSLPSTVTVLSNQTSNNAPSPSLDCNSEFYWSSIEIPWNKLSDEQLDKLRKGIQTKTTLTALVHVIGYEMRNLKQSIPTKNSCQQSHSEIY